MQGVLTVGRQYQVSARMCRACHYAVQPGQPEVIVFSLDDLELNDHTSYLPLIKALLYGTALSFLTTIDVSKALFSILLQGKIGFATAAGAST